MIMPEDRESIVSSAGDNELKQARHQSLDTKCEDGLVEEHDDNNNECDQSPMKNLEDDADGCKDLSLNSSSFISVLSSFKDKENALRDLRFSVLGCNQREEVCIVNDACHVLWRGGMQFRFPWQEKEEWMQGSAAIQYFDLVLSD